MRIYFYITVQSEFSRLTVYKESTDHQMLKCYATFTEGAPVAVLLQDAGFWLSIDNQSFLLSKFSKFTKQSDKHALMAILLLVKSLLFFSHQQYVGFKNRCGEGNVSVWVLAGSDHLISCQLWFDFNLFQSICVYSYIKWMCESAYIFPWDNIKLWLWSVNLDFLIFFWRLWLFLCVERAHYKCSEKVAVSI